RARGLLDAVLPDIRGHADHGMPIVVAGPECRAQVRPQTAPDRVLPLPELLRQRFVDDDYLALGRGIGRLEAAAGHDRDAHGFEVVAHDELVIIDDVDRPAIDAGVVLDTRDDHFRRPIRREARHNGRGLYAGCGAKAVEQALIRLCARLGL